MQIINKEKFVKYINDIQLACDYQHGFNSFLSSHSADGYIFTPDCTQTVMNILHDMLNDQEEWISYFCCELDFGRKYKAGSILCDSVTIKLETPEDLYDLVVGRGGKHR